MKIEDILDASVHDISSYSKNWTLDAITTESCAQTC
jgi:hypothetical protein